MWDKRQIVLPRLFCIHTFLFNHNAEAGGRSRREVKCIMKVLYHGKYNQLSEEAKGLLNEINDVWKALHKNLMELASQVEYV